MFHELVNHNEDLQKLVKKGYAIAIDGGFLIVRDIPYLDEQRELRWGAFVAKLVFTDNDTVTQDDHQVFFAGGVPHGLDGRPIPNLAGGPTELALGEHSKDVIVQRSFSNKPNPPRPFDDFFEKIESYVTVVAGPAMELYGANPLTFRVVEDVPASVFKIHDTMTSLAEITDLAQKFTNEVVAIIGLGGTGAYVLDLIVKTPVKEIRGFDNDLYHVHNAFRSPGFLNPDDFDSGKADVYQRRYHNFRHGLSLQQRFIDASSADALEGVTFAFVCVDKGSSRADIFNLLIREQIPFIDVGMGLNRIHGAINGMLRTTFFPPESAVGFRDRGLAPLTDDPNDIYRTNIQIAELNALNACLAVIKYKQLRGFYFEELPQFHLLFEIGDLKIVGESEKE